MRKIRRALLSLSDRTDVVELAKALHDHGCELICTGGTGRTLEEASLPVTPVAEISGNPKAFGGRMKTISFQIESALLFDRERDADEAERLGIVPIDMVVCNLYPFDRYRDDGADTETLVEHIDIGGPTMIRAAAKNFRYVAVVTQASDYGELVKELCDNGGALSLATRRTLMRRAFNHTADYDAMIAVTMDERAGACSLRLAFADGVPLRIGENAHQPATLYRRRHVPTSLYDMEALAGKSPSFNNILDVQSALAAVKDLDRYGCAVIKHTNPCGLSESDDQRAAIEAAWEGDPVSAFGSVIAFNAPLSLEAARVLRLDDPDKTRRKFVEGIIAPRFEPGTVDYLRTHKSLRVLRFDPAALAGDREIRVIDGACLVQGPDDRLYDTLDVVTEASPALTLDPPDPLIAFGIKAARQEKSNAIVVVRRLADGSHQLLGMGCGQPNRVVAARLALDKAKENLAREYEGPEGRLSSYVSSVLGEAILVSDAFFPFPDTLELAAGEGIRTILQPGGSIRDDAVIERANELGVAIVMTGVRHFRH